MIHLIIYLFSVVGSVGLCIVGCLKLNIFRAPDVGYSEIDVKYHLPLDGVVVCVCVCFLHISSDDLQHFKRFIFQYKQKRIKFVAQFTRF